MKRGGKSAGRSVNNLKKTIEDRTFWKEKTKMATSKEIQEDVEFAKSQLMNSDMSDDFKKRYNTLINISKEATNGISPEEKIQKMTEAIALLATTQVGYMIEIQNKIDEQISKANKKQCEECFAMKHAREVEKDREEKERFREYLMGLGIDPDNPTEPKEDRSWSEILKSTLTKPYVYVVLCLLAISPYSVEILKTIFSFFAK